ncbi:MAG: glycosyltransferase family 39 protein [bacterium]|nr:MAG: glycosyltransferase family 39 protein [bacterium]
MINSIYLTFSDGAKFSLIARNLVDTGVYATDFSFWGSGFFSTSGISILVPHLMSLFMKLFGVNDFAVISFSFFFFIFLIIFVFLLASRLFDKTTGMLASLSIASNYNFIDYATSGASETLFAFEIVLGLYLVSFKSKFTDLLAIVTLILMYFSRPQAIISMAGIVLYWLIVRFGVKKALISFFGLGILGYLVDKFVIYPLSFKYPVTPILMRGLQSILTYSPNMAVSDGLRGVVGSSLSSLDVVKKVFYNLYNFYKALPEIASPYMWGLFVIGMFSWGKVKLQNSFKISVLFVALLTFLVTALTIPFYRYIHPVVPLVYIVAVATLVEIIKRSPITKQKFVVVISIFLILFFSVGQTLGIIFLDSRFKNKMVNTDKAPIYVEMSYKLKEVTTDDMVIVTNLDTWGSWYGERKTIWFPLEPDMILPVSENIDAIYLTSYKMDDENYYMGENWREIFENPESQTILTDYEFVGEYEFSANDNYERESGRAILLVKKLTK